MNREKIPTAALIIAKWVKKPTSLTGEGTPQETRINITTIWKTFHRPIRNSLFLWTHHLLRYQTSIESQTICWKLKTSARVANIRKEIKSKCIRRALFRKIKTLSNTSRNRSIFCRCPTLTYFRQDKKVTRFAISLLRYSISWVVSKIISLNGT